MAGIYIHIPFCKRLCNYCDFYKSISVAHVDEFVDALEREMDSTKEYLPAQPIRTLYFGGGTPSVLSAVQMERILTALGKRWDLSGVEELTMEANPDDVTRQWADAMVAMGVNRVSLGVQSFVDRDLQFMNRRHTAAGAIDAVNNLHRAGVNNISIDLIYGLPQMSMQEWDYNLLTAIKLNVQHISAYHLIVEPRTVLGRMTERGGFRPIDEVRSEEQYLALHNKLCQAGWEHYEISNFARDGFRSRHNSAYWRGIPYLGLGPSAHSFDGVGRRWAVASLGKYLTLAGTDAIYDGETLDEEDCYNEYVMVSLRCIEGVDTEYLTRRFGAHKLQLFLSAALRLIDEGVLVRHGNRVSIPPEKWLCSDAIIADLFI